MKEYRNQVKRRMQREFAFAMVLVPLAVVTMIHMFRVEPIVSGSSTLDFIGGFFNGVRAPLVVAMSFYLFALGFHDRKSLHMDDTKLKTVRIEEKDERKQQIRLEASTKANWITMYLLLVASVVASWVNQLVSITLLIVWTVMMVITIITKGIYEKRL